MQFINEIFGSEVCVNIHVVLNGYLIETQFDTADRNSVVHRHYVVFVKANLFGHKDETETPKEDLKQSLLYVRVESYRFCLITLQGSILLPMFIRVTSLRLQGHDWDYRGGFCYTKISGLRCTFEAEDIEQSALVKLFESLFASTYSDMWYRARRWLLKLFEGMELQTKFPCHAPSRCAQGPCWSRVRKVDESETLIISATRHYDNTSLMILIYLYEKLSIQTFAVQWIDQNLDIRRRAGALIVTFRMRQGLYIQSSTVLDRHRWSRTHIPLSSATITLLDTQLP